MGAADEDSAGGAQFLHDGGVLQGRRPDFREKRGAGEHGLAGDGEQILQDVRDATQRLAARGGGKVLRQLGLAEKMGKNCALLPRRKPGADPVMQFARGGGRG